MQIASVAKDGRIKFRDSFMTFDSVMRSFDAAGNSMGRPLGGRFRTHDNKWTDSSGAFLVGELERLDLKMHEPLASVTWGRDIDLREDVTIADEVSSFTLSNYAASGAVGPAAVGTGKAWIGKNTDQITGLSVDIAKIPHPLRPWGMELKYTILELEAAAKIGRPVDQQKWAGLQLKHQMDIDEQIYIGDLVTGDTGLLNDTGVIASYKSNVATGAFGSAAWANKTPDEILADVNTALTTTWANCAWAVIPTRLLISPAQFGYISTAKVSAAGNVSILKYILENNILSTAGVGKLEIYPCKWCIGAATGGTIGTADGHDRMVVYTKDQDRVRYPMTMLQRTPVQYDSIYHKTTYFCRLGVIEVVYPETISYWDGI